MRRCILHVGHPKTGSTYLQTVLHLNEEKLLAAGYWVPSDFGQFGSYDCRQLAEDGHTFSGNLQAVFDAYAAKQPDLVNRILHYILHDGKAQHLLLSSELVFYYDSVVWDIIRRARAAGFQVFVVAYLARQDRAAISDYVQNIRNHGFFGTLLEFLVEQQSLMPHLRYCDVFKAYRMEAADRLVVRTFAQEFLIQGDLVSDFMAIAGCPLRPAELHLPAGQINTGLPVEWYEILRGLNAAGSDVSAIAGAAPPLTKADRQRLFDYYFSGDVRDYILSEFVTGNRSLVEDYLSNRSEGERDYWRQFSPAGNGVVLHSAEMANCLTLLQRADIDDEAGGADLRARQ